MKNLSLLALIVLSGFGYSQSYNQRYERIKPQTCHIEDFELVGNVKEVLTQKFSLNSNGEYVPSEYDGASILRFNKNGTLKEKIDLLTNGDTFQKEYYSYTATSLLATITIFGYSNTNNGIEVSQQGILTYSYDQNGRLIRIGLDGNDPYERKYAYDSKGRLVVDECADFKDEYVYEGDSNKILSCTTHDYSQYMDLSSVSTYHYSASNQLKSITVKINDREHSFRDYMTTYYEDGKLEMISTGDTLNINLNSGRTSHYYNDKGYLSSENSYSVYLGEGDAKRESNFTYTFDKANNWTERVEEMKSAHSLENKVKENWSSAEVRKLKTQRTISYY
jgi:hypothetical protein